MAENLKRTGWRTSTTLLIIIAIALVGWSLTTDGMLWAQKSPDEFHGYLFAKLGLIGSFSQGPDYFLQQYDVHEPGQSKDIPIRKKGFHWQVDPELHQFLGRTVTIIGELKGGRIQYEKIEDYASTTPSSDELKLDLKIEGHLYNDTEGILWINKQPSPGNAPPPALRQLNIALLVQRPPAGSIWHGQCPTSQLYDFFLEDPQGNVIWQWSKCMMFVQRTTAVNIWGGPPDSPPAEFPVIWHYFSNAIDEMGTYTVRSKFIATEQEVSKQFEIKFAY